MAKGGLYLSFSDGTNTTWVLRDTDNQLANSDATQVSWHNRTIPLDSYAGKTISGVTLVSDCCVAGAWLIQYRDLVLLYADGSVKPIFTGGTSAPLSAGSMWATSGVSGLGFQAFRSLGEWASYQTTTTYYHGDHLGSAQMMTGAEGWPVWSATYLPFGYEFNASSQPPSPTHYKFTGKERDSESGLDYFGARYYTNGLGRWISPDWAAAPTGVPYADFANPQSLNLYGYVGNSPVTRFDADGHCAEVISCSLEFGAAGSTLGPVGTVGGAILGAAVGGVIGYYSGKAIVGLMHRSNDANRKAPPPPVSTNPQSNANAQAPQPPGQEQNNKQNNKQDQQGGNSTSKDKAIRSLEKQVQQHEQKLADYKANPDAFDSKGLLKNATAEQRQSIINGRIRHLEKEIETFKNNINKLKNQ